MPPFVVNEFNHLVAKELADNWIAFRDINTLAGHNTSLDSLMIFSANDLIFALPLLAALLWLALARWSPYLRWLATRFGAQVAGRARWIGQRVVISTVLAVVLALCLNILLGSVIYEPRPFIAYPNVTHQLIHHAADASFPSDHEAVSMAIALTLALYSLWLLALATRAWRRDPRAWSWGRAGAFIAIPAIVGVVALAAAVLIGLARIFVGVHYPVDIIGGALCGAIGCLIALALIPMANRLYQPIIHLGEALRLA